MNDMKKGFTILELLVASLLLSMLVTILTMLFNQSSIAWRTGVAGVADLDEVRTNVAELRAEADNAYIWDNKVYLLAGLWDEKGKLRNRAWGAKDVGGSGDSQLLQPLFLRARGGNLNDNSKLTDFKTISVGNGDSGGAIKTYTINVKSAGPDRKFNTYDDIWSFPDEIN